MRMFVAGGTGVVGRPLVEALVDRGHEVTASTHRTENLSVIEALGARPALLDGLDDAAGRQAILEPEPAVISNQITALSVPSRNYARWLAVTNRLRSQGTKTLMTAARQAGTGRVVAHSASFMTQPVGPDPPMSRHPCTWKPRSRSEATSRPTSRPKHWCWPHRGSKASSFDTGFSMVKAPRSGRVEKWRQGSSRARCRLSARAPAGIRLSTSATRCRPPCTRSTGEARQLQRRGRRARPQAEWLPYLAELLDALRRGASPRWRPRNSSARKPCTTAPSSAGPATPRPSLSWG